MKRSEWGLTDIERRMLDEQRRLRNCVKAILIASVALWILRYITQ